MAMHPFSLGGRHIAITGAGGGIGSEAARIAAALGARVSASDLRLPVIDGLAGSGHRSQALDVSDRAAVEAWFDAIGDADALIDCAAICPFTDWDTQGWDAEAERVFRVNMLGPLNLVRAAMPRLKARGRGSIALVGSIAGRIGGVRAQPHYAMSKGGIHALVHWASTRMAPECTINAVAPGPVDTPMTQGQPYDASGFPMRRMASAAEIAGPLVFLVSPAAAYINGAVLDINGALHFS
jgi:NAD(P)-dependent dehydrogenase (short-subunit alcohol dehydrogenase family)